MKTSTCAAIADIVNQFALPIAEPTRVIVKDLLDDAGDYMIFVSDNAVDRIVVLHEPELRAKFRERGLSETFIDNHPKTKNGVIGMLDLSCGETDKLLQPLCERLGLTLDKDVGSGASCGRNYFWVSHQHMDKWPVVLTEVLKTHPVHIPANLTHFTVDLSVGMVITSWMDLEVAWAFKLLMANFKTVKIRELACLNLWSNPAVRNILRQLSRIAYGKEYVAVTEMSAGSYMEIALANTPEEANKKLSTPISLRHKLSIAHELTNPDK